VAEEFCAGDNEERRFWECPLPLPKKEGIGMVKGQNYLRGGGGRRGSA
jgi:hypothetical protein